MAIQPAVDVSDVQEALANLATHRETFNRALDVIKADANADSTRRRGRPLPEPSQGGDQIPAAGIQITEVISAREGTTRTRVVAGVDVAWQNVANHLDAVRARGNSKLDNQENSLRGIIASRQQPAVGGAPTAPGKDPGKDPRQLYPWLDFITALLAYVAVFYGLVAAAHSLGFFTIFIAVALLALTGVLQGFIIRPMQGAIRLIFNVLIQVILDIIEFIGTWLNGIIQYFQGDFIKAVLQILEVAAFMFLWSFAMRIPVIGQLIQFITDAVGQAIKFINDVFDQVTGFINRLRTDTENGLAQLFGNLGSFGKLLLQSVDAQIDRLTAGLTSRLNGLRFELIRDIDVVSAFLGSTITVFGFKLTLVPEEVRAYLLNRNRAKPFEAIANTADIMARVGSGLVVGTAQWTPPWQTAENLDRQIRTLLTAGSNDIEARIKELIPMFDDLNRGRIPETPDLPPEWLRAPGLIPAPPAPAPAPGRPFWVPALDWQTVQGICGADHIAYLAAAIGQHETNWGRTGRGPDGYILGVGVLPDRTLTQYQGLTNQLDFACPRLRAAMPGPETVTRDAVIAFGRDIYQVADPTSWGNDVFNLFASVYLGTTLTVA